MADARPKDHAAENFQFSIRNEITIADAPDLACFWCCFRSLRRFPVGDRGNDMAGRVIIGCLSLFPHSISRLHRLRDFKLFIVHTPWSLLSFMSCSET
jgi:hypothetical protein